MTFKLAQDAGIQAGAACAPRHKTLSRARLLLAGVCLAAVAACSSPEQKVEKYTKEAQQFLEEGKLGRATIQFQNALKINEDHVPAIVGIADVSEKRQDFQRMYSALQRVVRLDPDNVDALVKLGKLNLVAGDEETAVENADKALSLEPNNPDGLALKSAIFLKQGDEAKAIEFANRALEINPNVVEAVTVLATERSKAGDDEAALDYVNQGLDADPKQAVLHLLRIQLLKNLKREEEVPGAYEALISALPENAAYRRLYAVALLKDRKFEMARQQLVAIAELQPKKVDPVLDVVRADFRIGGMDLADQTFQKYIAQRADDNELKLAYASFLRERDDFEGAGAIYDALLKVKDDDDLILKVKNEIVEQRILQGDRGGAEQALNEILAVDDRNNDALTKLAGLQIDRQEYDEAINSLRLVLNDDESQTAARILMATAMERKGELSLATSEMAQAVEDAKYAPRESNVFAKFLVRNNDPTRAENVLVQSLERAPSNLANLKFLAALRLAKKDWSGAEEIAGLIDNIDDKDPVVNRILGAAYTGMEDFSSAIKALEEENERQPLTAQPLNALVSAYLNDDRADEAEQLLKASIEKDPANYDARILLAQVMLNQNKLGDARSVLEQAVDADPKEFRGYQALYRLSVREGRRDDAEAVIERGLQAAPEMDALKVLQGDFLLSSGREEEALKVYEDVIRARPNDRLVANNYASLLSRLRNDPESRQKAAGVAEALNGVNNGYFQDTLGWALVRNGSLERGIALLKKATENVPELGEIRYHLGAALIQQGLVEEGKAELQKAVEFARPNDTYVDEAKALLAQ